MLHLVKLCVGVRDVGHLRRLQQARLETDPPLRHRTRNFPRRSQELLAGGSLYWVIGGVVRARQKLVDIVSVPAAEPGSHRTSAMGSRGGPACALILDSELVVVEARPMKAFQGWRYMEPAAAPADVIRPGRRAERLPEPLREALAALSLL